MAAPEKFTQVWGEIKKIIDQQEQKQFAEKLKMNTQ